MRSYGQYCAVARALDLVGDRWTLLIVRELLVRPCRYGELQDGLPGVATNLLAERLRALEDDGLVTHDEPGSYRLTERGWKLGAVVRELARWGALLMAEKDSSDAFRSRWLEMPLALMFAGNDPGRPEVEVEIRTGDEALTLGSRGGQVTARRGVAVSPDLVLTGPPDTMVGMLSGRLDKRAALEQGASILGDFRILARLRRRDWLEDPLAPALSTSRR
jgi:DNA-binding HxlR family transcriptional regulator